MGGIRVMYELIDRHWDNILSGGAFLIVLLGVSILAAKVLEVFFSRD